MVTRLSTFFFRTLREDPSDAEVVSHRLLVRAGYIRRQAPGIFAWLPLGLMVKNKIENIIREEMAAAGAHEVHFPALLPAAPYQETGRYDEYGDGMFRLHDRRDTSYVLAPTHEEVFTLLVKDLCSSYKDLPLTIYQIQDKYRDEARPRGGLLRGREFTMKDAYSFDVSDEGLAARYEAQRSAYERIFKRLELDYVIVTAHSGAMGGSRSEEFLHPTPVGEDTFVQSPGGYAANVEAYTTPPPEPLPTVSIRDPFPFDSPATATIATLVDFVNNNHPRDDDTHWDSQHILKNVVLARTMPTGERELVVVGIPADRDVDMKRAEAAFAPAHIEPATDADFAAFPDLVKGYIGPWTPAGQFLGADSRTGLRYFVDPRVVHGTEWITGANVHERHVRHLVAGRDFVADGTIDVAEVRDGDPAPDGSGPIVTERGMEIGHIFQLGRKYAETLGLQVLDENGSLATVTMGSYGIGVTRLMAVIAENAHDEKGLAWPKAVAPCDVHVVAAGKDASIFRAADDIASALESAGQTVLYDDRLKVSPGVKFADAELMGIPTVVVVGRGVAEGTVELWDRHTGDRTSIPIADLVAQVVAGS